MKTIRSRFAARWPLAAAFAFALAACGGSSGGGSPPPPPASPPPPPAPVTVSGKVTYDFVPVASVGGLDYAATEARPVRLVTVQFVDDEGIVLATTSTDRNGDYSLEVAPDRTGFIRVRAQMSKTDSPPRWFYLVRDNTNADAVYVLDGAEFSTGTTDSQRDLHAPSGWTGSGYGNERAAAPFAILDTILVGMEYVLSVDATITFPSLNTNWSPDNVPALDENGDVSIETGEIGSTRFSSNVGLLLLGAEDVDTEEYDRHIVLHEYGHYLEFALGRSDSIGGPHALGDTLDMRVAYSEGFATAFSALALDDPDYRDTGGTGQAGAFGFSVEGTSHSTRGWYSEVSIQELIYDLVDTNIDANANDFLALPLATVWPVLVGPVATTSAVTSIFPFLNALKAASPGDAELIDGIADAQDIDPISTDYGDNETNDAGSDDVLPVFSELTVEGPAVEVCSTDEFTSGITGAINKLGSRRFVRFTPFANGNVTITARATSIPDGEYADPDFIVYRQGFFGGSQGPPSDACMNIGDAAWAPGNCEEVSEVPVAAGEEYVIEVYEWTNTNDNAEGEEFPPIGRTCFDVTVTQP